jgi:hypothetical protein
MLRHIWNCWRGEALQFKVDRVRAGVLLDASYTSCASISRRRLTKILT